MKQPASILTCFCLMSTALTGCITVKVDEERIFLPPEKHASSVSTGLGIRDEDWLNDRYISIDNFTLPVEFGNIALTYASQENGEEERPLFLICMGAQGERYRSGRYYIRRAINIGDVLLFDYPGYNDSDGEPTIPDFQIAAAKVSEYVTEQMAEKDRQLVLWGHSLGGFVCSDIARENENVDAVILETTAQNIKGVVAERVPALAKLFIRPKINASLKEYDNAEALKDFAGPVLVLGAGQDEIIGVELQRALAEELKAQGADVTYIEYPDANHFNVGRQPGLRSSVESLLAGE